MIRDAAKITGFLILCCGFYIFITAVLGAFGTQKEINQFLMGVPKFFWDVLDPLKDGQKAVILFLWATAGLMVLGGGFTVLLVHKLVPDKR